MIHVPSTVWRIINQPSNSTSCSDNGLQLLILVADWGLQVTNLGLHFEGLFWEQYILKGQIVFEGLWRLQSWTLGVGLEEFQENFPLSGS